MKKMKYVIYIVVFGLFLTAGCSTMPVSEKKTISVSILPLGCFVERISGGDFEIAVLVPPGASPETYECTPSQMREVMRSSAYFHTGLIDFEQVLSESIRENAKNIAIIDLSDGLSLIKGSPAHGHAENHSHGTDPHTWLSPVRVKIMVENIGKTLTEIMPDSAEKYLRNTQALISSIDSLDRHNYSIFEDIENHSFLIYHPFLTYYASDYGLEQIAVEQEGKEPSAKQFKQLLEKVQQTGVETIFFQQGQQIPTVKAMVRENGLTAVSLDPLAADWFENINEITSALLQALE